MDMKDLSKKLGSITNDIVEEFDEKQFYEWEIEYKQEWKVELQKLLMQFSAGVLVSYNAFCCRCTFEKKAYENF